MSCVRYDRSIEAYIDGECQADEAAVVRKHLRVCSACRRRADRLRDLQELVHGRLSAETAPPGLWQNIAKRLDQNQAQDQNQDHAVPGQAPLHAAWDSVCRLAAMAAVVVALVVGTAALWPQAPSEQAVVHETVEDFVTFQLSGRPFDAVSSDPTAVRAWFAGKINFDLPPMKARAAGYKLVGSRLCWLLDRRLGAFAYRRGDRFMTLYVMDGEAVELPVGHLDLLLGVVASRHRVGDYNSLVWRRGSLVFSLVSDASEEEMTAFATGVVGEGSGRTARADGSATGFATSISAPSASSTKLLPI